MSKDLILGVLMVDTRFPRVVGDVGNPRSYDFPVRFKVVEGVTVDKVVTRKANPELLPSFIKAAQELEREGVKMITTSCGFLVIFQDEIASAVKVPVFTSSLLQVPLVYRMVQSRIGIITANAKALSSEHLKAAGAKEIPVAVEGLETQQSFSQAVLQDGTELDVEKVGNEVVGAAQRVLSKYPDIGAFVLECHNLPPYGKIVQEVTERPVFDILTLVEAGYRATVKRIC